MIENLLNTIKKNAVVNVPFTFGKTSPSLNREIVDYLITNKDYTSLSEIPTHIYSEIVSGYAKRKVKDIMIEAYNKLPETQSKTTAKASFNHYSKPREDSAEIIKKLDFKAHWDFCQKNLKKQELNKLALDIYLLGVLNYKFLDIKINNKNPIINFYMTIYNNFKLTIDGHNNGKFYKYSTHNELFITTSNQNNLKNEDNNIYLDLADERLKIIHNMQNDLPINNIIKPENLIRQLLHFDREKTIFKKIVEAHKKELNTLIGKYIDKTADENEFKIIHNTVGVLFNQLSYKEIAEPNSPYHLSNFFQLTFKEIIFKGMKYKAEDALKRLEQYITDEKYGRLQWSQLNFEPAIHQYPLDRLISIAILSNHKDLINFFFDNEWLTEKTKTDLSETDCEKTFSEDIKNVFGKNPSMPILLTSCIVHGINHPITQNILSIPNTKENSLREISGRLKKRNTAEFPYIEKLLLSLEHYDHLKDTQSKKIKL